MSVHIFDAFAAMESQRSDCWVRDAPAKQPSMGTTTFQATQLHVWALSYPSCPAAV